MGGQNIFDLISQGISELLNTSLTGSAQPVQLYQPNSANPAMPLSCNGQNNVLCPNQISATAQKILNLYPLPNINGGKTYSNYAVQRQISDNTWQWDTRMDWNISQHDQVFARFSYLNEPAFHPAPLAPHYRVRGREGAIYSRGALLMGWALTLVLVPLARGLLRQTCARRAWWGFPAVILGEGGSGGAVAQRLLDRPELGLKPVAILDDDATADHDRAVPMTDRRRQRD